MFFYKILVSKTAAKLKIVCNRYINRECNGLVLPNRSHFSSLNQTLNGLPWCFISH